MENLENKQIDQEELAEIKKDSDVINKYEDNCKIAYAELGKNTDRNWDSWGAGKYKGEWTSIYTDKEIIRNCFTEKIKADFADKNNVRILDLGGGDGFVLNTVVSQLDESGELLAVGANVDKGLFEGKTKNQWEINKLALENKLKKRTIKMPFDFVSEKEEINIKPNSIDAEIMRFVIQYSGSETRKKMLRAAYEYLKPGGKLYCLWPGEKTIKQAEAINKLWSEWVEISQGINSQQFLKEKWYPTLEEVEKDARNAGFTPIEIKEVEEIEARFSVESMSNGSRFGKLNFEQKEKLKSTFLELNKQYPGIIEKDNYRHPILFAVLEKAIETNKNIISIEELQKIDQLIEKKKSVMLIDGQVPNKKGTDGYFFYSDELKNSDASPFGLARIGGYLDKHGVANSIVRLKDYDNSKELEKLWEQIKNFDIIGISGLSGSSKEMFELCSQIKQKYPEKIIIGGREHFGLDFEWILSNKDKTGVDLCCTSQGELPMLALSLGISFDKIGSVSYNKNKTIAKNTFFPRLEDSSDSEILKPHPAKELSLDWYANIFPEFKKRFRYCGDTMIGSGCPYNCKFCANSEFLESRHYTPSINIAKEEVVSMKKRGMEFFFVRDLLINADENILKEFNQFMIDNSDDGKKMNWAAFMSVKKHKNPEELFKMMSEAGCVEIMVGVEDIIGDRKKLKKGAGNEKAAEFIDLAKNYMLARTFLMLGLPEHYNYSREEIKNISLEFMKQHPQAIYRMGLWTPIVGTEDFKKYKSLIQKNVRKDLENFKLHDTMHDIIDHEQMYDYLNIPQEKRWAKEADDWEKLRDEIIEEYYKSKEYKNYLDGLKENSLLFESAKEFQNLTLERIFAK